MFKKLKFLLVSVFLGVLVLQNAALAQGTLLPKAEPGAGGYDCDKLITEFQNTGKFMIPSDADKTLGCAVVSGRVSLAMVPHFIKYISNYLLGIIGLVALLFTVLGGFLYTAGGLTEQKDKGKAYIKNALIGMGIAFLAWSVVNVIMAAITG